MYGAIFGFQRCCAVAEMRACFQKLTHGEVWQSHVENFSFSGSA